MPNRDGPRHLADLDSRQRLVATRPDGHLLVIAGPGAGKTRALTARIAHLVHARGIDPATVVAFTFSRRAATELRGRVARMDASIAARPRPTDHTDDHDRPGGRPLLTADVRQPAIWASTIHAFGVQVLRRGGASHFQRRPDFTVYDDDDTDRTLRRILAGLGVRSPRSRRTGVDAASADDDRPAPYEARQRYVDKVGMAARAISLVKRSAIRPAEADVDLESTDFPTVFAAYEDALQVANAFDFDDLVALATRALLADRALHDRVSARVRHLLVDEFQDTDSAQFGLIEALNPGDLCVVADPQQSIYGFRGASPDVVGWFVRRWPHTTVVRLDRNYRSSGRIVALAQRIRDAAPGPGDDRMRLRQWTRAPAGEHVRTWATNLAEREARLIANDIGERLQTGTRPDEIAVLVRTRAQLRPLEAVLIEREAVPYEVVGGAPFFARTEVRDILAYLRLGASPDDAAAFWRVVNVPRRGLGPAAALAIGRETISAEATSRAPESALRRLIARDRLPDGAYDLLAVIDEVRARIANGAPLGETIRFILDATAYGEYLKSEYPEDASQRALRIDTLASLATRIGDVRRFLDDAVLATTVDSPAAPGGCVRISTIHASKGTEYDHVYVAGCEDGLLPIWSREPSQARAEARTAADVLLEPRPSPLDHAPRPTSSRRRGFDPEERRIFYVAVTRARRTLTLSYAGYRANRRVQPSHFLNEIGSDRLLRCEPGTSMPIPAPNHPRLPTSLPTRGEAISDASHQDTPKGTVRTIKASGE